MLKTCCILRVHSNIMNINKEETQRRTTTNQVTCYEV